ncbi:MAG: phosphonoacetate hydrolase [Hyphomicrobiales bacterium]|nr:phosphonoacetate hydrolase [Hyphomicrobiales bacterium]MBV8826370.1 phosphonoacetate hydrolase [Hyphomicrobiales bacterium]MBV9426993.1 phosphonoacetate hydrolase [Bradyrhizobiaceae bacterium]
MRVNESATRSATIPIEVNGVTYRWPERPVVVVCNDGGDPDYLDAALKAGVVPHTARFMRLGFAATAQCVIPGFTCPNNVSIVTGSPPAVHGISGNFYLEPESGRAVVMTGPELMRAPTVLASFSRRGAKVISITAKDKLRRQLGKDMDIAGGAINFSSEKADRCSKDENGIANVLDLVGRPLPDMYSPDLSLFVLAAGVKLLEAQRPLLMYLSLTDFVQHTYAPGSPEANRYYQDIDAFLGRLDALGAVVGIVSDHGMREKANPDGSLKVVWLQDELDRAFGAGTTEVICPITDYFVAHHGSLGSFVRVYCRSAEADAVMRLARALPGIEAVHDKAAAARAFDLPLDREGDVVVISDAQTCIGTTPAAHDLEALAGHTLRTHGGFSESRVPFILNRPLNAAYAARAAHAALRNFHMFDFAINGTA